MSLPDREDDAELREFLLVNSAMCPRCGYDLSGHRGGVCPECGKRLSAPSLRDAAERADEYCRGSGSEAGEGGSRLHEAGIGETLGVLALVLGIAVAIMIERPAEARSLFNIPVMRVGLIGVGFTVAGLVIASIACLACWGASARTRRGIAYANLVVAVILFFGIIGMIFAMDGVDLSGP